MLANTTHGMSLALIPPVRRQKWTLTREAQWEGGKTEASGYAVAAQDTRTQSVRGQDKLFDTSRQGTPLH